MFEAHVADEALLTPGRNSIAHVADRVESHLLAMPDLSESPVDSRGVELLGEMAAKSSPASVDDCVSLMPDDAAGRGGK